METKIIKIIEDILRVPAGSVTKGTKMEEVEQWDSLMYVMIIGQMEKELGIQIPLDEVATLKSVQELIDYVTGS